jgi:hypothetical protein
MDAKVSRLERRARKREERETYAQHQREQFSKRQRNKRIFNYAILAVIAIAIAYGAYVWLGSESSGQHDVLAQCLRDNGVTMYGTDWCPHCQEQKRLFGASFKYVTYVNCDLNAAACQAAGVEGYPTWVFPQGPPASGEQPLATLAERAGCLLQ